MLFSKLPVDIEKISAKIDLSSDLFSFWLFFFFIGENKNRLAELGRTFKCFFLKEILTIPKIYDSYWFSAALSN
jgi:hypothetical protein